MGRFSQEGVKLVEGENQLTASAIDAAGNESVSSEALKVLVDVRAPLIGLSLIHISEPTRLGMSSYDVCC